jgi:hypothetical protein
MLKYANWQKKKRDLLTQRASSSSTPRSVCPMNYNNKLLVAVAATGITICHTFISSSFMNLTRPETTVLGSGSPTSIFSTYKESASGCLATSKIFPTTMSSFEIIDGSEEAGAAAAAGFFSPFSFFSFFSFLSPLAEASSGAGAAFSALEAEAD